MTTKPTETTTTQPVLQNCFFRYDLHQELPGRELQQFSSTDMNGDGGEQEMLDHYQFKPLSGPATEPLHYFSSTYAQDHYMAIAHTEGYRLIVFIADEASLLAFRRKYDFAGAMLPRMLMPAQPPAPNNLTLFKMNTHVLR